LTEQAISKVHKPCHKYARYELSDSTCPVMNAFSFRILVVRVDEENVLRFEIGVSQTLIMKN